MACGQPEAGIPSKAPSRNRAALCRPTRPEQGPIKNDRKRGYLGEPRALRLRDLFACFQRGIAASF